VQYSLSYIAIEQEELLLALSLLAHIHACEELASSIKGRVTRSHTRQDIQGFEHTQHRGKFWGLWVATCHMLQISSMSRCQVPLATWLCKLHEELGSCKAVRVSFVVLRPCFVKSAAAVV
jgi:hypothetical protein